MEENAVACVDAHWCVVVGGRGDDVYAHGTVSLLRDGELSAPQVLDKVQGLLGVACVSTEQCYAVGFAGMHQLVVPINNGTAGAPSEVEASVLLDVGCPPASQTCYIVGGDMNESGLVIPVNAGGVGEPQSLSDMSGLSSISCTSGTVCFVSGQDRDQHGSWTTLVNGEPQPAASVPQVFTIYDVDCRGQRCVGTAATDSGGLTQDGEFDPGKAAFITISGGNTTVTPVAGVSELDTVACLDGQLAHCLAAGTSKDMRNAVLVRWPGDTRPTPLPGMAAVQQTGQVACTEQQCVVAGGDATVRTIPASNL